MAKEYKDLVVGLDIGTAKVMAVVAEVMSDGQLKLAGLGVAPSNGLKRGVVVNIDATVQSIQQALKEAELMADCKIGRVYTGITGSHIRGINSSGMVAVKDKEVSRADVARVVATVPEARRPRVYYARGPKGLETGLGGSINVELLGVVGARNVAAAAGSGGIATVSPEQVLAWDPDVILTQDAGFRRGIAEDPLWSGLRAVRAGRVYQVPALPFGWFDAPPGANRLIGVRWLAQVLYPDLFPTGLEAATRDFYRRFYHVELEDGQVAALLAGAAAGQTP